MKISDRYHEWVEWSEEDQVYIGRCPDLMTGIHSEDPVQLYGELCEIVDELIEDLLRRGRELPEPLVEPMRRVVTGGQTGVRGRNWERMSMSDGARA